MSAKIKNLVETARFSLLEAGIDQNSYDRLVGSISDNVSAIEKKIKAMGGIEKALASGYGQTLMMQVLEIQNTSKVLYRRVSSSIESQYKKSRGESKISEEGGTETITKSQLKKLMSKYGIVGEVSGAGKQWEVELPDEKQMKLWRKTLGKETRWGGYKTGYGGYVLTPTYKDSGDWSDPASRFHY